MAKTCGGLLQVQSGKSLLVLPNQSSIAWNSTEFADHISLRHELVSVCLDHGEEG